MIDKNEFFASLPEIDQEYSKPVPSESNYHCIVVLDDDPTGTQTIHHVPVITRWDEGLLSRYIQEPIFFINTNSRSLDKSSAYQLVHNLCSLLYKVAEKLHRKLTIITRTDSTLRGHFMAELDAIEAAMAQPGVLRLFIPAFIEGGRFSINDHHYVQDGEQLLKAESTPFATDKTFGYSTSQLPDYIREKDPHARGVSSISIEEIRNESIEYLINKITSTSEQYLIVNAADHSDLNKIGFALRQVIDHGQQMIIRSAAGIIPGLSGIQPQPLLGGEDFRVDNNGGIIIVGSYVPKSTSQLKHLLDNGDLESIEINASELIEEHALDYIESVGSKVNKTIGLGLDLVIYTSRSLLSADDPEKSLQIVNKVSQGLIGIVNKLAIRPSFVIAKGGITSSDVATKALGIEAATVMGQLLPGIPVWECGDESKYPGMPYVIFPGNVGQTDSLTQAYKKLTPQK